MAAAMIWILLALFGLASGKNIARGGKATQSSTYETPTTAEKAVDGNRDSMDYHGCTHTQQDNRPWWRLDLLKRYKIYTVTITNRGDAVPERLDGAEIRIGDSLEDKGNSNPRCAVISSIAAGASETFNCEGMVGQYVNIVIPDRQEYLTLCEVEVSGEPAENIARRGQATQSSNYEAATTADKAVDGNRDSVWGRYSCTTTQQDNRPWWRLDLLKRYKNLTVTIINRGDAVPERLDGAEIHIGDSLEDNGNSNPSCAKISSIAAGASKTFNCKGMTGQYINIVIPDRQEYLTLCEVEVSGEPADLCPTTNIARGGKVTQSSNYETTTTAEKAVDGNRDSVWAHNSCATTQQEFRPWWRLDLQKRYQIYTVTITNRGDAVPERLDGAWIHIGDSLEDNGNSNPRCAVIPSITAGATKTFKCEGMTGQYVNIVIPKRFEYLTLCEVEVTGDPAENIVIGGQATQSSNYEAATTADKAVDGNRDSMLGGGSCTHTQQDNRPWWRLDLQKRYKIYTVTITNRGDAVPERLDGAEIHIGDSLEDNGNSNPRCAEISSIAAGASETFNCEGMTGQYINIVIPDRQEYLTLCEVEVSGEPAVDNIARRGRASQSSDYMGGVPGLAIDGKMNSMWDQGSCTLTSLDHGPWWRLDLLKMYKICTVTITNRRDAFSERLDGAEIRIGDSLEDNGNSNPRCAVIESIAPGASRTFKCSGMKGRYINVVIPNKREYLTLCEVEVTGTEYNEGPQAAACSQC